MNPKILALRDAHNQVTAAEGSYHDACRRAGEAAKKARQAHDDALADYNASLPPKRLDDEAGFRAYLRELEEGEIVRPCFLHHEGRPTTFPCLVVSVRAPQRIGPDVTYQHRFVTREDAAQLGPILPRFFHYGIDKGDRPACDWAGGSGWPVVQELPTGGWWCGCCQVVLREKTGNPKAFANPGETFPEPPPDPPTVEVEDTCHNCGAPMTFHGCVQLGCRMAEMLGEDS